MGMLDAAFDILEKSRPSTLDPYRRLLQATLSLLADDNQTGGVHGLAEQFTKAGLITTFGSWVASGPNLPVSAIQIKQVLGEEQLQQMAERTGFSGDETASRLSGMLPDLVDMLTPRGCIPEQGLGKSQDLLDQFMGPYH